MRRSLKIQSVWFVHLTEHNMVFKGAAGIGGVRRALITKLVFAQDARATPLQPFRVGTEPRADKLLMDGGLPAPCPEGPPVVSSTHRLSSQPAFLSRQQNYYLGGGEASPPSTLTCTFSATVPRHLGNSYPIG